MTQRADRFDGRVALITGAASGIGAATARRLAAEGARVLVTDVDEANGKLVADEVGGEFCALDARDADDWEAAVARAVELWGRLDVLHLNTGRNIPAPLDELAEADLDSALDIAIRPAYHGVRAALPELRRNRGSVVVTASVHAVIGLPGAPAYAAAKGALVALARQLAVQYGPEVRVNAVLPGPIQTSAWRPDDDPSRHVGRTVAGRMGQPEEVAAAVAFLASDDASYITGVALPVDGGWTARGL